MESAVRYWIIGADLTPEKKKQAESAARYWATSPDPTPEKKKQVESAVRYRVISPALTPEEKKQAESAVWDSASNESKNGTSHDGVRCTVLKLSEMLEQVLNLQPK